MIQLGFSSLRLFYWNLSSQPQIARFAQGSVLEASLYTHFLGFVQPNY